MRFAQCSVGALAATIACASASAKAQTAGSDKVTAEALFEDARKLVADKKYADACPKFADSERLDPSAATLLNLASCWEKVGRTATAWATYKQAASSANAVGRKDYLAAAERHADTLAPTLARLTISVAAPVEGIVVKRDGANVDRAEWGTAIPIDPGPHALEASAPGHKDWSTSVDVAQSGAQVTAQVPALEPASLDGNAGPAPMAPAATGAGAPHAVPQLPPAMGESAGSTERVVGWVVSGLGIAGLAVSGGFALAANKKYNDSISNTNCEPQNHNLCNATGLSDRSDARSAGDGATVAFALGGAALAGGIVILLTAPRGAKPHETGGATALALAPTLGGAMLKGAW